MVEPHGDAGGAVLDVQRHEAGGQGLGTASVEKEERLQGAGYCVRVEGKVITRGWLLHQGRERRAITS